MTSGNIAVFDHDAGRVADLVTEFNRLFGIDQERSKLRRSDACCESLADKKPGEPDIEAVLKIKALIRWSEAKAGASRSAAARSTCTFSTCRSIAPARSPRSRSAADDVRIIRELLEQVEPQQIYVAGDLSDPHGTHRVCAEAIFRALAEHRSGTAAAGPKCGSIAAPGRNGSCTRSRSPCRFRRGDLLQEAEGDLHAPESRRTRPCSPAATPASSGSGPKTAIHTAAAYNQSACPSTTRWKASCGGMGWAFRIWRSGPVTATAPARHITIRASPCAIGSSYLLRQSPSAERYGQAIGPPRRSFAALRMTAF